MSNVTTTSSKEKSKIFETILSTPGMNEKCKIVLTISRQNILVLGRLIETGFIVESSPFKDELLTAITKESSEEFKTIHEDIFEEGRAYRFLSKIESSLTVNGSKPR
jgi:hypothetical protein